MRYASAAFQRSIAVRASSRAASAAAALLHQFGSARGFADKVLLGIKKEAYARKAKRQAEFAPSATQPSAASASRPAAVISALATPTPPVPSEVRPQSSNDDSRGQEPVRARSRFASLPTGAGLLLVGGAARLLPIRSCCHPSGLHITETRADIVMASVAGRTRRLHSCRTCREGDRQQTSAVALLPQVADADSQELSARRWPRRITPHPSRAGANDDNETSVPPGGNLEGPGVACGAQPHAEDMTHCRLGIPRAEKWPAITIQ